MKEIGASAMVISKVSRRGRIGIAVIALAALAVISGVFRSTLASAATATPMAELVQRLSQTAGQQYPTVVARVDGVPISGQSLAQREIMVQGNQSPTVDKTNPKKTALNQLIQQQVLLNAAQARGLTISDSEISQSLSDMIKVASGSADGHAAFQVEAAQFGIAVSQLPTDSRVIAAYRASALVGAMKKQIAQGLPASQQQSAAAINSAVASFVASSGAHVEVLVSV